MVGTDLPILKAVGRQGWWFAQIKGNLPIGIHQTLPCIHNRWRRSDDRQEYDDIHAPIDDPKWPPFLEALRENGQAIETKDDVPENVKEGTWKRVTYIAVYEVHDVQVIDGHLRFRFGKRLAHLE